MNTWLAGRFIIYPTNTDGISTSKRGGIFFSAPAL